MQFIKEFTDIDNDLNNLKDEINTYTVIGTPKYIEQTDGKTYHGALSIRSNVVEEYTLLVCIAADGDGKTSIVVNPYYTHESTALCKPGNAILFRKDLICKDDMFTGHKKIMIVDIWVSRKDTRDIVLVEFPEELGKSYALSKQEIMKFPDSMLAGFCRFKDSCEPDTKIHTYKCTDCTYDEFSVVFKVLTGMYISVEEAETYLPLLNYFGLFEKDFTIDFITPSMPTLDGCEDIDLPDFDLGLGGVCCVLCGRVNKLFDCAKCKTTKYCSRKCQTIHWKMQHSKDCCIDETPEDFVILPEIDATAKKASELLQPYARFKIIFADGARNPGNYEVSELNDPIIYRMEPVYVSFGDYSNLYLRYTAMQTWARHKGETDIKECCDEDITALKPNTKIYLTNGDPHYDYGYGPEYKIICVDPDLCTDFNHCEYDLLVAKKATTENIIEEFLDGKERLFPIKGCILPSEGEALISFNTFHIDSTKQTAFTAEQAAEMVEYIKETKLIERIAKNIVCSGIVKPKTYTSCDKTGYYSNAIVDLYVVEGLVLLD